jgi:hypothetical protein
VRIVLVDLKQVELSGYNGLPHLMVPVITEPERAKAALRGAVTETENRYWRFAGATSRNIRGPDRSTCPECPGDGHSSGSNVPAAIGRRRGWAYQDEQWSAGSHSPWPLRSIPGPFCESRVRRT